MNWIRHAAVWCAACGGYLLYAGEVTSLHEWITAVVLATGASVWAAGIHRCGRLPFSLSFDHTREWAKAAIALGPALARTFPILVRAALSGHTRGQLLEIPFRRGGESDPRADARRASALLIASLGPDNFVVRAPIEKDRVLMHAILPENASRDPRWLNQGGSS